MGKSKTGDTGSARSGIEIELLVNVAQMRHFEILSLTGADGRVRDNETAASIWELVARGAGRAGNEGVNGEIREADSRIASTTRKTRRQRSIQRLIGIWFKPDRVNKITI